MAAFFSKNFKLPYSQLVKRLFISTVFVLASLTTLGQLITRPKMEHITEKDGMDFSFVLGIVQDQQGFIWLAGAEGISRYDGYQFLTLVHKPAESTSLYANYITSIALGPDDNIWLGHFRGKISVLNTKTFKVNRIDVTEAEDNKIGALFFDSQKTLWVYIENKGLHEYNGDTFIPWGLLPNMPEGVTEAQVKVYQGITRIHEDEKNQIWLGTNNGLYRLDQQARKIIHVSTVSNRLHEGAFVHAILPQGDSVFWLPTYGDGIIQYNRLTGKHKSYLFEHGYKGTHNVVYGAEWKNNEEIIFHANGLVIFNTRTRQFNFLYDTTRLEAINPGAILKDQNGIIWVTSTNGLLKYEVATSQFTFHKLNVTHSDNRGNYIVTGVLDDSKTERKIVTTEFADGIHIFDNHGHDKILTVPIHPSGEPYQFVRSVKRFSDGRILILTRDNLHEVTSSNQLKVIAGPAKLFDPDEVPYLYRFIESRNGDIWIASSRNGLIWYQQAENKWRRFTTENSQLAANGIIALEEDREGKLWLGYRNTGLGCYNPATGEWKNLTHTESDTNTVISNHTLGLTIDKNSRVWTAALEGLSIYDQNSKTFKHLTKASGLPVQSIGNILVDKDGNVWAIGSSRVLAIRPDLSVREFGYYEGLSGSYSDFTLLKGEGEEMFIGGSGGYFSFNPRLALAKATISSPIAITQATIGNQNIQTFDKNGIELSYDNNHVQLNFAALNFMSGQNKYEYRMEGLDNSWTETNSHRVTYSGLPSGNFVFRVRLKGEVNKNEATLQISVSTPFWKTIWFRVLAVLVGVAGTFAAYQWRSQQIRNEEKLKSNFNQKLAEAETKALKAQMSPHFIFNSLNSINRYIIKAEPEKASLYLTKFSKLIRLILDNSNQKIISLEQELLALKLYIELETLRFNEKFTFNINVSPEVRANSIGVPPMIIQPFVENSIWHGLLHKETPGHLVIEFEQIGSGLKCTITDNGIGRKKAAELKSKSVNKEKSYGMQITRERLSMMNKESKAPLVEVIDLEDETGSALGTKVIIKIMGAELEPEF